MNEEICRRFWANLMTIFNGNWRRFAVISKFSLTVIAFYRIIYNDSILGSMLQLQVLASSEKACYIMCLKSWSSDFQLMFKWWRMNICTFPFRVCRLFCVLLVFFCNSHCWKFTDFRFFLSTVWRLIKIDLMGDFASDLHLSSFSTCLSDSHQ